MRILHILRPFTLKTREMAYPVPVRHGNAFFHPLSGPTLSPKDTAGSELKTYY